MKKSLFLIIIFSIILNVDVVLAATNASISVSTSSTVVGNSGTATLTITSDEPIGQIYGTFSCGGLGKTALTYSASDSPSNSKSYTINWKASSVGTYTCSVSDLEIGLLKSQSWPSVSVSSKTISVISPASNSGSSSSSSSSSSNSSSSSSHRGTTSEKKTYSSDNTLADLGIEGYDLSPKFSSDVLEYTLEVDESVEEVNVIAKVNDKKASISGDGKVAITPGVNNIEVKVTAENGNDKVYKIVVTSKDQNPILVSVDGKEYTVVKKNNDIIDKLEYYEEDVINIDDQEVMCYKNENSDITLIILKDEEGNVDYYIYDSSSDSYSLYKEIKIGNLVLYLLNMEKKILPDLYKEYDLVIGEDTIKGYKLNKSSKFYLIYAMNVESGDKSLYLYDEKEDTIQRYDNDISKYFTASINNSLDSYKDYFYIVVSLFGASIIVLIVMMLVKRKGKIRKKR